MTVCKTCFKQHCRWKDCIGKSWYAPSEIFFCSHQCLWLISNLDTLLEGNWPIHPEGVAEAPRTQKMPSHHAPYETAEMHAGEIEARIGKRLNGRLLNTGVSGQVLIEQIKNGLPDGRDITRDDLLSPAKDALDYISGWSRRGQTFAQFMEYRRRKETRR